MRLNVSDDFGLQVMQRNFDKYTFLISGACKSNMAQQSQISSQPLEVTFFINKVCLLEIFVH